MICFSNKKRSKTLPLDNKTKEALEKIKQVLRTFINRVTSNNTLLKYKLIKTFTLLS